MRIILCLAALISALIVSGAEVYDLDGGWKFALPGGSAREVNLPHTWNADGDHSATVGTYLREVNIPAEWNGRRIFVRFGAAGSVLNLIVNGRHAGEHCGGYTASTFEITDMVNFGRANALRAIVSNSPRTDVLPTAGESMSWGGLTRGAQLLTSARTAIALTDRSSQGVYLSCHRIDDGQWEVVATVKIDSRDDCTVQAAVRMVDAGGNLAAESSERVKVSDRSVASLDVPLTVREPRLWDGVDDPHLYDVRVTLSVDGVACDSTVVRTGLRDYGYDPARGFMLNGRAYPLRGVTLTQDRMGVGTALDRWQLEQDVELVRELGANLVWVTPGPHGSEFYELCDREGLMVVSGVPFTGDVYPGDRPFFKSPAFMQNGRRQLSEMIRQGFNHPSIVMWSIFECVYRRGDDPLPYIKELAELAKKEDPGRLTVCRSNHDGELNFVTDMVLWQHRFGWSSGTAGDMGVWLEHLHRSWSNLYSGVSYGAGGQPREQPDSLMRPSPAAGARHPERWQTLVHEETWQAVKGDSALWCVMLDNMFDSPTPAHSPGINDMGLVSFDRSLRKDAFWFYKAKWNFDHPFVRIAESRWTLRGNPVQTLRVFSNCPRVELFVAGRSIGVQHGTEGVFTWPRVTLPAGRSFIEARSGEASHSAEITISPVLP